MIKPEEVQITKECIDEEKLIYEYKAKINVEKISYVSLHEMREESAERIMFNQISDKVYGDLKNPLVQLATCAAQSGDVHLNDRAQKIYKQIMDSLDIKKIEKKNPKQTDAQENPN